MRFQAPHTGRPPFIHEGRSWVNSEAGRGDLKASPWCL